MTMQESSVEEPDATHGQVMNATQEGTELAKIFADEMSALYSSSFKARRVAHTGLLPIRSASTGSHKSPPMSLLSLTSVKRTTGDSVDKTSLMSPSASHDGAQVVSQVGYTNTVPEFIWQAYVVAQQLSYMFFTGVGFLLTTWGRCIMAMPNTLFQPLNFLSMILFASVASAFLVVAAVAAVISLMPVVGPLIQSLVDYVMVGPYGPGGERNFHGKAGQLRVRLTRLTSTPPCVGVRSALYYNKFPEEIKARAEEVLSSPVEPEYAPSDGSDQPRTIDLDVGKQAKRRDGTRRGAMLTTLYSTAREIPLGSLRARVFARLQDVRPEPGRGPNTRS